MNAELFKCLRETHGHEFEKFMLKRLVPVPGDLTQTSLGLEEETARVIIKEIDIIVSSGANTTFDERFLCDLNATTDFNTLCLNRKLQSGFKAKSRSSGWLSRVLFLS